jgi:hypothetical protein
MIVVLLPLFGCDQNKLIPQKTAVVPQTPTDRELSPEEIKIRLEGGTDTIEPSSSRTVSGDLRPLWIVTGKVRNATSPTVKTVKIRIIAYDSKTHDALDTADIEVDDIQPQTTKAFRREVPLMIHWGKFYFYDELVSATEAR